MATIKMIEEDAASPDVRALYDEIKASLELDFVPTIFKAMAHDPNALRFHWENYKSADEAFGTEAATLMSLAVDVTNGCTY